MESRYRLAMIFLLGLLTLPFSPCSGAGFNNGDNGWGDEQNGNWDEEVVSGNVKPSSNAPVTWDDKKIVNKKPSGDKSSACQLSTDKAVEGEYAYARVVVPETIRAKMGRIDLFVNGEPVSGGSWAGRTYRQLFKVPEGKESIPLTFVVQGKRSQTTLCQGALVVQIERQVDFSVTLHGAKKLPARQQRQNYEAKVSGGMPPYSVRWYLNDRLVFQPSMTVTRDTGFSSYRPKVANPGPVAIRVSVNDAEGRNASKTLEVEAYACSASVGGPAKITVGKSGAWTAKFNSKYPPFSIAFYWSDEKKWTDADKYYYKSSCTATHTFKEPGRFEVHTYLRDRFNCETKGILSVEVDKAPSSSQGGERSSPRGCKSGFAEVYHGKYCCRPGSYYWDRNALMRGDCYRK